MDAMLTQLITELTATAARNTASVVQERVRVVRASKANEATVQQLEEIINELIDDRAELVRISNALKEQLVAEQISDEDIALVSNTIAPLVAQIVPDEARIVDIPGRDGGIEIAQLVEQLLSGEMLQVLQVVGLNFREAIGVPLTEIVASAIRRKGSPSDGDVELAALRLQREIALYNVFADADARGALEAYVRQT